MNARHSDNSPPSDAATSAPLDIAFMTARVSPMEIAAVTAVLTAAVNEQSADTAKPSAEPSAWQHSQRRLRTPIAPALDAWRGFSG